MTFDPATLKPGDEVAVSCRGYGSRGDYRIEKVAKVTPSGQIVLGDGSRFTKRGHRSGDSGIYPQYLVPVTDKIREVVHRNGVIRRVEHLLGGWSNLPTASLERLAELLAEVHPK